MATIPHESAEVRGTGRSTKQILDAPHGSFYLVNHGQLSYTRRLACKHRRPDLQVMDVESFFKCQRHMGRTEVIVVDHCLLLDKHEYETVLIHNSRYVK